MKLYLSSYRLGNHAEKLKELVGKKHARVAVSINALDFSTDLPRKQEFLEHEMADMRSLGFQPQELDLRKFFGKDGLLEHMKQYDLVWFTGGNVFILAKAFRQSGFGAVVDELVKSDTLVYAGYSAAFCVLTNSLHGGELVDDKDATADGYEPGEIWEGMGLIDFYPIVHFRSDHPESDDVEKEFQYVVDNKISHKTFRDGDVYLVDGTEQKTLSDS